MFFEIDKMSERSLETNDFKMKTMKLFTKAQEAELQKLLQVHLKLPSTALWFEPPTIGNYSSIF